MKNFEDHLSLLFMARIQGNELNSRLIFLILLHIATRQISVITLYVQPLLHLIMSPICLDSLNKNTKESQAIYISNDVTEIGKKEAADGSLGR